MDVYERIKYKDPDTGKNKSTILRNPRGSRMLGCEVVTGTVVDIYGVEKAPAGIDQRLHIIDLACVTDLTPMRMNNHYAMLEEDE
jgi:hypothetical protein